MATVGWIDAPEFDLHINGIGHPECPERLSAVREGIACAHLDSKVERTLPRSVERKLLEAVHRAEYISRIENTCASGGGYLDPDTSVVRESFPAALMAAGGVADAVRNILAGHWQRAFCSVRPPGHHAPAGRAMGFCLFNNVAVGAQAALSDVKVVKVAILDWDVHHGNGTQAIFWSRPDVFYASWHQYPFYPGTGAEDEVGEGAGVGATLNCPLPAGAGDREYLDAWEHRIRPALEDFAPDFLMVSAGFDADLRDPLAGLRVTPEGFAKLSAQVVAWADDNCDGRLVSVLEGGYSLEALKEDVGLHVATLVA